MQHNYFQKQPITADLRSYDRDFEAQRVTADIPSATQPLIVILRLPEVTKMVGLEKSEIYKRIANNQFPAQVSLGGRAVGWVLHEIQQWLADLIQQSRSVTTRPNGGAQ